MIATDSTVSLSSEEAYVTTSSHDLLFRVLHCRELAAVPSRHSLKGVGQVRIGRGESTRAHRDDDGDGSLRLSVADTSVSSEHALLVRDDAGYMLRDCGSKNGSSVDGERMAERRLHDGALIELGGVFFVYRKNVQIHEPDFQPDFVPTLGPLATLWPPLDTEMKRLR